MRYECPTKRQNMTLICGILSPTNPERVKGADLELMLNAAPHHTRDGRASFVDEDDGLALGCSYTATFSSSQSHQAEAVPLFKSDDVAIALAGTVWPFAPPPADTPRNMDVVLPAFARSPTAFADDLDGDFNLALWDRSRRRLHLVSDPIGKKPLYYSYDERLSLLIFASELKALLAHPSVSRVMDRRVLPLYLGLGFIPAPFCLVEGVRQLMPAEDLVMTSEGMRSRRYWLPSPYELPKDESLLKTAAEECIAAAVSRGSNNTEAVGVFLSGGLDSSVVLAAAKQLGETRVTAFNLAYESGISVYDQGWAEKVAAKLDCPLVSLVIPETEAASPELTFKLLGQIDEPFESAGRVFSEHFLLEATQDAGINSCLTGGGAGFLFGRARWQRYIKAGGGTATLRESVANFIEDQPLFDSERQRLAVDYEIDQQLLSDVTDTCMPLLQDLEPVQAVTLARTLTGPLGRLGLFGAVIPPLYGAEERSPFYDRRVIEFSLSLPFTGEPGAFRNKGILKNCFDNLLAVDFSEREKRAYPRAPLPSWLRESIIGQLNGLVEEGILKAGYLQKLTKKFSEGRKRAQIEVWQLFVLHCWYEIQIKQRNPF